MVPENERGPIARSYADLQSLGTLFACDDRGIPPGSGLQAGIALFRAGEVAMVNLAELAGRATADAAAGRPIVLLRTVRWMVAIARAWSELAWRIADMAPAGAPADADPGPRIEALASPNWARLHAAESGLATGVRAALAGLHARDDGTGDRLAQLLLRYVMLERTALEYSALAGFGGDYEALVQPGTIRAAVAERELRGRTVLMQFRAGHQMPELVVAAANDHIAAALAHLENRGYGEALEVMRRLDRLLDVAAVLMNVLADELQTAEYHQIRENLGLTSGSHSVNLHFHLMRDLLPSLVAAVGAAPPGGSALETSVLATIRALTRAADRHVDRWRLVHLNLPRNNLGAGETGTRSLTGSPDALLAVTRMREAGLARTAHPPGETSFRATDSGRGVLALAELEQELLAAVAARTQDRFRDVQQRTGRFAAEPEFRPPPIRRSSRTRPRKDQG
ncbi:hypothetical protein [Dactylosporangium sp. CS-033363]|uniref:hypothetical protein n=1 Tax=Dactylosporangium sp. CS-033363 TaxID=3239935 RepID=UPI003D8EE8EB